MGNIVRVFTFLDGNGNEVVKMREILYKNLFAHIFATQR